MNCGAADRKWIAAAVVWILVGAACGGSDGTSAADKVGNERDPITLTLATSEEDAGASAAAIQAFVNAVDEASAGRVVIEPRFQVHWEELEWDQRVIADVADGDFDLVLARAGAWNTLGVTTLDALQLPGLIESDEQADRIVANHPLVERLLAGVDDAGLTGLGLYPDAPRYLVSLDGTSGFAPADLRGRIIRSPLSETAFDVFQAVGMTPVDMTFKNFTTQVSEGNITMTDIPMSRIVGTSSVDGGPAVVADNLMVYTKFLVLAASSDSIAALDDDDAALIVDAASDSIEAFVRTRERDVSWVEDVCEQGHLLVDVTSEDRAAFLDAASSVVDAVASTPDGDLVGDVRAAAGEPGPHDLMCPNSTVPDTTVPNAAAVDATELVLPTKRSDIVPTSGDVPDGVYRFTQTLELLQEVEPQLEHTKADEFIGEYVLKGGTVELRFYGMDGRPLDGPADTGGVYQVVGDLIIFAQPPNRSLPATNGIHLLRWSLEGDTLTLEQVDDKRRDPDFVAPLIRVGDAP